MGLQETLERSIHRIEEMEEFDDVAEQLQSFVNDQTSATLVKNALSGVWLGHPVHPPLTDLSVGAFTAATLFDLLPGSWARSAADALVCTGLAATVPTVITGANDWADTKGATRRVGLVHAAANATAAALYGWSLLDRARGRRRRATTTGMAGWLALLVGGTLGGHLAYRRGVGVNENAFSPDDTEWHATVAWDDLAEKQPTVVTSDGVDVVLYRVGDQVHALADRCSHLGGPLHQGHVHEEGPQISCPWHHSTFRLEDGSVARGPASAPQPRYETRVRDGQVEIRRAEVPVG